VLLAVLALAACNRADSADREEREEQAEENPLIEMQPEAARRDPRTQIFLAKGCAQCHAISRLQVVSPTNVGPDLSTAAADVPRRFGVQLDQFMGSPTGTMQIVLSGQIQLSAQERDSIVALLRRLDTNNP
jgi:mono/diheme cytochrome c family protein